MAITQIIATLPAVLNDSATFYEDIAERNNSLVTTVLPSINAWASQANTTQAEINAKALQVAAQAVDGGYSQNYINTNFFSQNYINTNFVGVNNAQNITAIKTFTISPIVPTPITDFQVATKQYVDEVRIGLIDYAYVAKNYHIVAFGGEFNRADYPKLWAYLQANPSLVKTETDWQTEATTNDGICGFFSDGDGTTTFRVPNLNKAFLRPDDRGVGSYQVDEFKNHTHSSLSTYGANVGTILDALGANVSSIQGSNLSYTGGIETRPKNIAVLPLIVAK